MVASATAIRLLQYALPLEELNGADKVGIGTYRNKKDGKERRTKRWNVVKIVVEHFEGKSTIDWRLQCVNVYIASIYYYILNICSINYNIHTCIQYIAFALSWLKVDVLGCDSRYDISSHSEPHAPIVPGTPAGTFGGSWFACGDSALGVSWSCRCTLRVKICSTFPSSSTTQQSAAYEQHSQACCQLQWAQRCGAEPRARQSDCDGCSGVYQNCCCTGSDGHHQPLCLGLGGAVGPLLRLGRQCGLAQGESIWRTEANWTTCRSRSPREIPEMAARAKAKSTSQWLRTGFLPRLTHRLCPGSRSLCYTGGRKRLSQAIPWLLLSVSESIPCLPGKARLLPDGWQ